MRRVVTASETAMFGTVPGVTTDASVCIVQERQVSGTGAVTFSTAPLAFSTASLAVLITIERHGRSRIRLCLQVMIADLAPDTTYSYGRLSRFRIRRIRF